MLNLEPMGTAVTFIEDHLQDDINVADIATATSYSLYHFCRVFNQTVHHPPYDYLIRRRLSEAAQQLSEGKHRITDIAFTYQFGSLESFSRAFRRMFEQLPTQWRKQGICDPRVLMRPLTPEHLAQRSQPDFHRPAFVKKETFTVVGLMTWIPGDGNITGTELAVSQFQRQLSQQPTHILTHYPDHWAEQGKWVLAGTLNEAATPPLVAQTIQAQAYACFVLPAVIEERPFLSDYIYQTWLPQSGYKLAAPMELVQDRQLWVPIMLAE
jgi:AraC family transcriptional regulator